jgi:hypothetical protein
MKTFKGSKRLSNVELLEAISDALTAKWIEQES